MRGLLLIASTVVFLVAPLLGVVQAKEQDLVTIGARVRVVAPGIAERSIVGVVSSTTGDALLVRREGSNDSITIPRAAIQKLELSHGKRSKAKAALIGGLIGAGAGAVFGAAASSCNGDVNCEIASDLSGISTGASIAAASLLGAGVGALVGSLLVRGEKWQIVSRDKVSISLLTPGARAVGLRLAVAF